MVLLSFRSSFTLLLNFNFLRLDSTRKTSWFHISRGLVRLLRLPRVLRLFTIFPRYRVTWKDFEENRGRTLLKIYKTPGAVVQASIYGYDFLPWLFEKAPQGFWNERANRLRYIEWLVAKCGLKSENEIKAYNFRRNNGVGLLLMYGGSPYRVLESLRDGATTSTVESGRKPQKYFVCPLFQDIFIQSTYI